MHKGQCFCGKVSVEVTGNPEIMLYCHCESCRVWSAGPVNAAVLWKESSVKIITGSELIKTHNKTPGSTRSWCENCGGHIMNVHPSMGLIDLYHAITPTLSFEPKMHVNASESVIAIKDDLPRFKDLPKEMGGSGDLL